MKTLGKAASRVLDQLVFGLACVGDAKKIDNSTGFMAVHVERVSNAQYSVAHYYEQNGEPSWWEHDAQGIPLCRVCGQLSR